MRHKLLVSILQDLRRVERNHGLIVHQRDHHRYQLTPFGTRS